MPLQSDPASPVHNSDDRSIRFRMLDGDRRVLITVTIAALREFAYSARKGELLPLDELFALYRSRAEATASTAYDKQEAAGRPVLALTVDRDDEAV